MRIDLSGKVAAVTGGANGIGRATVRGLIACGASVWILDLAGEQPEVAAKDEGAAGAFAVDVTDPQSLEGAFAQLPAVDILVANAGVGKPCPLTETGADLWDRTIAVNLTGAFRSIQCAARRMIEQGRGGAIVVTASTNSFDGEAELIAYNASKAGVLGLVHTAANELGAHGIRVNAVCPGLIRTRLTDWYFDHPETLKPYFQAIAMGRGGEPEEVAQAIVFLASGLASYITGAALLVDGGQMASKFSTWTDRNSKFVTDHWERQSS